MLILLFKIQRIMWTSHHIHLTMGRFFFFMLAVNLDSDWAFDIIPSIISLNYTTFNILKYINDFLNILKSIFWRYHRIKTDITTCRTLYHFFKYTVRTGSLKYTWNPYMKILRVTRFDSKNHSFGFPTKKHLFRGVILWRL